MENESHYNVRNSPPLVPNLSQMNSVQALPQHYFKTNLILSFHLSGLSRGLCVSGFQTVTLHEFHSSLTNVSCPTNLKHFILIIRLVYGEKYIMKLLIKQFSPFSYYSNPLRSKYVLQHHILENAQPLFLPQQQKQSFTQPCQSTGKTTFLFILILIFFDTDGKTKYSENELVAGTPQIYSALNFLMHVILISLYLVRVI